MNNIKIRQSIPGDVEQAVPLIYSSGPAAFDYVFKTNEYSALDYLKYAFQRPGGEFSFQNHYSVVVDDCVVGAGAIFTGNEMWGFTMSEALNIIKFYRFNGLRIMPRGLRIESLIKPPRKYEAAIGHLGIHESMRGKGLGTMLINELMLSNKIDKQKSFVLDVSIENPQAQRLYEKFGFEVSKKCLSKLKNQFAIVIDHNRMEKEIPTKSQVQ
ncbi:GNAT family N-acetyltransferase [Maribacter sp. HTCC2170]|uniref:GNAT family N-acetyltransferase n=1 Tax=Maribacter sp. (strain HTCC2170 / KCCM 42371) TaxID=313603 RepID=UPI00006AFDBA|nr:GNAT family N-acetyltransferase [Maribacter sp. HTCC2170]